VWAIQWHAEFLKGEYEFTATNRKTSSYHSKLRTFAIAIKKRGRSGAVTSIDLKRGDARRARKTQHPSGHLVSPSPVTMAAGTRYSPSHR